MTQLSLIVYLVIGKWYNIYIKTKPQMKCHSVALAGIEKNVFKHWYQFTVCVIMIIT